LNKQLAETEGQSEETIVLRDQAFEVLSNPRRREVLRYLRAHEDDGPILLRDLAEQTAAWENGVPSVEVTYKQRKRVYTSLYQSHLPRLHRYDFIEYDADRGTVELTPLAEKLDIYLETDPSGYLPWSNVYLGTSIVVATLAVALYLTPVPFVSGWHTLGFAAVLFFAISLVHTYKTRQNRLYNL
jgi:hypothetical protein